MLDGVIIIVIIGDEEGDVYYGMIVLLDWMNVNGEVMIYCIVGEFISLFEMGEVIKIGCCGLLMVFFIVMGV